MKTAYGMLVCLAVAGPVTASEEKPTTRVYTNDDLERVRDKRGETGVTSEVAPAPTLLEPRRTQRAPAQGERYWRQETERERRRLAPLQDRLLQLQEKLLERQSAPTPRSGIRPPTDGLAAQIDAVRRRIREQQSRFEDRARREGALPGWLR